MDLYARKVSGEEAQQGRLLVEKRALSFFPPVGEPFVLDGHRTRVEAEPCSCRGPDLPHEHWFIAMPGLRKGARAEVERIRNAWRCRIEPA